MLAAMLAEDNGWLGGFSLIAILVIALIVFAIWYFVSRR